MPRRLRDLQPVQMEQKAVLHPMKHVKIALLERQVHPVPQHAKLATKERLIVKVVIHVIIVYKKPFKIKTQIHVCHAKIVLQDGNNLSTAHQPASVSIGKQWKVAKTPNT